MKKLIILFSILLLFSSYSRSQYKVCFSLANRTITGGILSYDVKATVPIGQIWKVGSCNIRLTINPSPVGSLTVHQDNPAVNANPNISNANGYSAMNTTIVGLGNTISLNIITFLTSGFYQFVGSNTPYTLGKIRFNYTLPFFYADSIRFRTPPESYPTIAYDSTVQLSYPMEYCIINPIAEGINILSSAIPDKYDLYQNYPNPFNPATVIKFQLPKNDLVSLRVYDVLGKEIKVLVNDKLQPGYYEAQFLGGLLPSGIYFYKLETRNYKAVKKMVLLK